MSQCSAARFFSRRLLNPFRGVTQFIEVGGATATSRDGQKWQLYADDGMGWVRPIGVWEEGAGQTRGTDLPVALRAALKTRPLLPFPAEDVAECWLLDVKGEPLALIASAPVVGQIPEQLRWWPFVEKYTGFVSPSLVMAGVSVETHATWLAEAVNLRAGLSPRAAWFEKRQSIALLSPAHTFLEQSVVHDYHAHIAPLLLAWSGLNDAERTGLEALAFANPVACERGFRLWPQVLDHETLQAARVAARFMDTN